MNEEMETERNTKENGEIEQTKERKKVRNNKEAEGR